MWTVTAEAPVDEIYEALKAGFDDKHVKKQSQTRTTMHPRRGVQEHTKIVHVVDDEMTQMSLQFRLALKSVQQQASYLTGKNVKVTIKCDEKSVSTKVEEV